MTDRQTLLSTPSAGKTFHINSALPGSDMVSGTDGNDTVYAKASGRVVDQIHIYAGGGDDTMHLNLAVIGLSTIQHGHHVFGGKGADMFRFCHLDVTRGTLVGRIDDLTAEDGSVALMPLRRSKSRSCDHQAASGKSLATKSISFSTPVLQLSN